MKTRKITQSALISALASVLVIISSILPSGRLAAAAIAGLCMTVAVMNCGTAYAAGAFAVSSIIGLLLSPVKGSAVAYLLFLGWYPIAKSPLEKISKRAVEWIAKLCVFNASFVIAFFAMWNVLLTDLNFSDNKLIPAAFVWIAANVVFVVYDIGLSQMIAVYMNRILKNNPDRRNIK